MPKAVDEMVECVEGLFPAAKLVFSGKDSPATRDLISQGTLPSPLSLTPDYILCRAEESNWTRHASSDSTKHP